MAIPANCVNGQKGALNAGAQDRICEALNTRTAIFNKPSVNKTMKAFHEFRELIFDSKGNHRTDREYPAKPGSACKFCEFYDTFQKAKSAIHHDYQR